MSWTAVEISLVGDGVAVSRVVHKSCDFTALVEREVLGMGGEAEASKYVSYIV